MAGAKTTVSFIHIGFIFSPTVMWCVPMISILFISEIENTSARGLIQGGSRGVGPGVWIPPEICQRWGPVWRFDGKDNVRGGIQGLCLPYFFGSLRSPVSNIHIE